MSGVASAEQGDVFMLELFCPQLEALETGQDSCEVGVSVSSVTRIGTHPAHRMHYTAQFQTLGRDSQSPYQLNAGTGFRVCGPCGGIVLRALERVQLQQKPQRHLP